MLNNDYIEKLLGLEDVAVTNVEDIGYDKHIHLKLHVKPSLSRGLAGHIDAICATFSNSPGTSSVIKDRVSSKERSAG